MTSAINITRTLRVENESGVTGSEAEAVNSADILEQLITAASEEQTAMGAFKDHQLQALSLSLDVDGSAQFLGVRYPVLQTVAGPPGTITYTGDLEQEIYPGDIIRLEDMPAAGDDGLYQVATVVEAAGTTTITLANGQDIATAGGGAVGTLARVCSRQNMGYAYTAVTVTAASGAITFTGDLSDKFAAGDWITINNSTGNDGVWQITSVTYAAPTTTIIVETKAGANTLPDNTNDGVFQKIEMEITLAASVPYLWSIEGGLQNPFIHPNTLNATDIIGPTYDADRGDVAYCMVTVDGTTNGNFSGRICTDPALP